MTEEARREVEAFAREILYRYFCDNDVEFLISTFDPEIVWLGGGEEQRAEGSEAVARCFREGRGDLAPCRLWDERYVVLPLDGDCVLCEGEGELETQPGQNLYMRAHQRVTFIFRKTGEGYRTLHIHNSIPFPAISPDELFPTQAARDAYEARIQRADAELRRQADFLTQLYNTVPCGIIQFATDGTRALINANRMAWEIYGYTREEYFRVASDPVDLVRGEDRARILSILDALILGGGGVSYIRESIRKDGSPVWINVQMERLINADGVEVIQAVFTDISEIRRLQEEREREQLMENRSLRAAICTAYPVILNLNLTRNTFEIFLNEAYLFPVSPQGGVDGVVQASLDRIYPAFRPQFEAAFSRRAMLDRFATGENELYLELRERGDDGAYHWVSIHAIHVDNPYNDDVLAVVLLKILDDQRAEKARQEQLLRDALAAAEAASRAKSDFLSRMSHDIRTPMNAIIGMTAIGAQMAEEPERMRDCLGKIDASSRYLLALINDILDMSKIEQGKMTLSSAPFVLNDLLGELEAVHRPQCEERGLELVVRHSIAPGRRCAGDALRLKQILMNLLSNAIKFTSPGGRVTVEAEEHLTAGGRAGLRFRVSDTGVGMSEAFLKRLYQPFEQEDSGSARNNTGSGLGLSIVHNLVQLMGGSIRVESRRGRGTTFTVDLVFPTLGEGDIPPEPAQLPGERRETGAALSGRRVLLAEDNELNREIARTLLEMEGMLVDEAENGAQAVEAVACSAPGHYLAVLMDIRMPLMDGLAATRAIRSLKHPDASRLPIVAMTANAFEEDRRQAAEAGISGYLVKPIEADVLMGELKKHIS